MSQIKTADTPERERLAVVLEEMGESLQVIGKIMRHGTESTDPTSDSGITNRGLLEKELAHVEVAIELLVNAGDLQSHVMRWHRHEKWDKLTQWLHHTKNVEICARRAEDTYEVPDAPDA